MRGVEKSAGMWGGGNGGCFFWGGTDIARKGDRRCGVVNVFCVGVLVLIALCASG